MNKSVALLLSVLILMPVISAKEGVDVAVAIDSFDCFAENGITYTIIRGYRSVGSVDQNA